MHIAEIAEEVARESRRLTHRSTDGTWNHPQLGSLLPRDTLDRLSKGDRRRLEQTVRRHFLVEAVGRHARELTQEKLLAAEPTSTWRLPELNEVVRREGLGIVLRTQQEPMRTLLEEGMMACFKAASSTEYTTPVHQVSLADLVKLAADRVRAGSGGKGRRTKSGSRSVEYVTASNLERIEALCTKIARYLAPDRDRADVLKEVAGQYLVWNENDQEWTEFRRLCRAATRHAGLKANTRHQYVGAGIKLLDLAATHGWIARSPRHAPDYEPVPADWANVFSMWRAELVGERIDRVQTGLMSLFEACARLDEHPQEADWEPIVEHLEDWFRANDVDSRDRSAVRKAYRVLRAKALVFGPEWDGRERQRREGITLLSASPIEWVAKRYGRGPGGTGAGVKAALTDTTSPWIGWERYEDGLVSGPYGLRRAILFFTALSAEAEMLDLPSRGVFPDKRIRGSSHKTLNAWRVATVKSNLTVLLHLAGWLAQERGVDWTSEDLRSLVDPDHLEAYRRRVYAGANFGSKRSLERVLSIVARLASPYLETVALSLEDEGLAETMQHVSAKLSASTAVDGRPSWLTILRHERQEDRIDLARRHAREVENAWTAGGREADFAYVPMTAVRVRLIELLEERYGTLGEQFARIRDGDRFDREWAAEVQDALFWQDQLTVPLRGFTARWLNVDERLHSHDFRTVRAEIPADKMKEPKNGSFHPNYCTAPGGSYRPDLYSLHVMKGGARELLRTTPSGVRKPVPAFYVPDIHSFDKERFSTDNLSSMVWRIVKRAHDALGSVTPEEIQSAGGLGTHFFRHAFATFLVRNHRAEVAKEYLHHSSMDMLQKVYAASGPEDYPVDVYLQEALNAQVDGDGERPAS